MLGDGSAMRAMQGVLCKACYARRDVQGVLVMHAFETCCARCAVLCDAVRDLMCEDCSGRRAVQGVLCEACYARHDVRCVLCEACL